MCAGGRYQYVLARVQVGECTAAAPGWHLSSGVYEPLQPLWVAREKARQGGIGLLCVVQTGEVVQSAHGPSRANNDSQSRAHHL